MLKWWKVEKVQNFTEVNLIRYNLSLTSLSARIKVERDTQPLNINLKSAPGRDFWNIVGGDENKKEKTESAERISPPRCTKLSLCTDVKQT